ncbi:MAG: AsmA family protein [Proteobacteria bacterium]|nr:AsmA family protein [Pseudomonadota bacterium]MBU1058668.1 AsmA family protein [Pseudomonadota bacterium]
MKRMVKWVVGGALVCVVIVVGLMLLLPLVLDPNDYKGKITDLIHEKSGYRVEIPGEIRLQVTPRLDILFSLGQLRVLSGADFPDTILLNSEDASVELSLLPLLQEKRLDIQGLSLHGVYCNLIRDKEGKGNWMMPSVAAPASSPPPVNEGESRPQEQIAQKKRDMPSLDLGSLELSRITVRYEDQQAGKVFELKDFSVHTGRVRDGQLFHLQSAFVLASSGSGNGVLSVENLLKADITFSLAAKALHVDKLSLVSNIKAFGLEEIEVKLTSSAFLELKQKKLMIDSLTLASGDLSLAGKAEITDFAGPAFHGSLQIPEFSLRDFLEQNKIGQPAWKDDTVLKQFALSFQFHGDGKTISVSDIHALLDGSHGHGSFTLVDPAHPSYSVNMQLDRLNFDRYASLPSASEPAAVSSGDDLSVGPAAKGSSAKATSLQPLFPVELLKGLDFRLELAADSMKSSGVELSQVQLKAQGKNGLLEVKPFQAELYSGTISAESVMDVRGETPRLQVKKDLDHVHIGPLLLDMTGKEEISGIATLSVQLETTGNSKEAILRHANGTMNLDLEEGTVKKLQILKVIRQAKALYNQEQIIQTADEEPTAFAHVSASGVIREGVFYNDDLKAASDLMKVTGKGEVDFADERVDYLLNIFLTKGLNRDDESGRAEYNKAPIPYRVKGKFSELKEEADVAGLLKSQAQNLLMNELQKQLNKGDGTENPDEKKDTTKQLLEQGLKGLFGN